MTFKVGLLGLGTVGSGTARILLDPAQRHPLIKELEIAKIGVRSLDKPRDIGLPQDRFTTDLDAIVTDPDIDIIVEVIGGLEPARNLMLKAIEHGKHVVTANKAAIALYSDELFTAAEQAGVYILLEAAVGGGIPVIEPLKQSLCANRILGITGIINGTTNYILTRMKNEGGDFADILADAQALGYAEADPTADVDGGDAADKIAILASLAYGGRIDRKQVHSEGIRAIAAADIAYADSLGFVIKLLAFAQRCASLPGEPQKLELRVHPTLVPLDHPLASVNGVNNAIFIEGDPVGKVMFFGPGAGSGPTASAVVADVLNIAALLQVEQVQSKQLQLEPNRDRPRSLDPLLACRHQHDCDIAPINETVTRFYLRLISSDRPGTLGFVGTCFGNHGVSLESIVQTHRQDGSAEIAVVTHDVQEGKFRQAMAELTAEGDRIRDVAAVIRVL